MKCKDLYNADKKKEIGKWTRRIDKTGALGTSTGEILITADVEKRLAFADVMGEKQVKKRRVAGK